MIRALIEAVVVPGGDSRGGKHRRLELHGALFRMLDLAQAAAAEARGAGFVVDGWLRGLATDGVPQKPLSKFR
ncbi:hypothetical protein [Novosphingobium sp. PY1]|jgi:hypothetical protein|uniref:hypothetical protein n=1 Tax=Novosphingobium sp. PY1 TaxID=1882221 RepID=UPI001A8F2E2F|nr:hypothetical protein [Novosphingobium sp. PY1]GFM30669.1 putative uncharacterized protein [Novosphingobium sp. PY1]